MKPWWLKTLIVFIWYGASLFAKKLHSKGVELSDWRFLQSKSDLVTTDCLIGTDSYCKIVNPLVLPKLMYGIWLTYTLHGKTMLGSRIPGGTKVPESFNVNNITNLHVPLESPLSILSVGEYVEDANAFDVARQLNNYDAIGIHLVPRE